MLRMSINSRALHAYISEMIEPSGKAISTWGAEHGVDKAAISDWLHDKREPTFDMMRRVAAGLGVSILDVLVKALYLTEDEVGGHTVAEPSWPSIDAAIEHDPGLRNDAERQVLRTAMVLIRDARAGEILDQGASIPIPADNDSGPKSHVNITSSREGGSKKAPRSGRRRRPDQSP